MIEKNNVGAVYQQQIGSNPRVAYGGNVSPFNNSNFGNSSYSGGNNHNSHNSNYYPQNINNDSLDGNQSSGAHHNGSINNGHPFYTSNHSINNLPFSPTYSGPFQHGGPSFRESLGTPSPLSERHGGSFSERGVYPPIYNSIGSPSGLGQNYSGSLQRDSIQGFANTHNSSNLFGHTNTSGYHSNNISSNSFGGATPPSNNYISTSGTSNLPASYGGIGSYNTNREGYFQTQHVASTSPFGSYGNQNSFGSSWAPQQNTNVAFGSSPPYRKTISAPGRSSSPIIPPFGEGGSISAVRQPKGPDGTQGFNSDYQRSRSNSKESKEIQKQMSLGESSGESLSSSWTLFGSSSPYPLISVTSKSVDSVPFNNAPSSSTTKPNPSPIGSPFSTRNQR
eukprot:TRINITY_DN3164_c0_g1_i10.p1 TRINITY_DN3164_c0_g1~~TRINITY_DN3164_c0_g1_i10.p1  ORF type:complete len:393 (+),score=42.75 TRINITY_DN3164_c0_g1_i10:1515-2693(+)